MSTAEKLPPERIDPRTIPEAIRHEAFAGLPPATRDVLTDVLSHIKRNLALKEEVACARSSVGSPTAAASASGE